MPNRDEFPICPDCGVALEPYGTRLGCDRCGGTLVTEVELVEMMHALDGETTSRTLAWPTTRHPSRRKCPRCAAMMSGARMEGVAVERCDLHGIWFDHGELAKVVAPHVDPATFDREMAARRAVADQMQYGSLGVVIRDIYRAIGARLKR